MKKPLPLLLILLLFPQVTVFAEQPDPRLTRVLKTWLEQSLQYDTKPVPYSQIPDSLPGKWKVSICVRVPGHAWIRFENLDTKEVVTLSRFQYLSGGKFDWKKLRYSKRPVTDAGVWMNRELGEESKIEAGNYLMISTFVDNPKINLGPNNGEGHGTVVNNCATYCRDAWFYYTGEYYHFDKVHSPIELRNAIIRRHPDVLASND